MFRLYIDGQEAGKFNRVSLAKKWADMELEIGACFAEIKRGSKVYSWRRWDSYWK